MNREVSVTKRVRTAKGLRYCPVVFSANGRIKPDYVLLNGKPERHPEGSYYISWYSGTKLNRVSVGKDAATATARHQQKTAELNAINNGVAVLSDDEAAENEHRRTSLENAIDDYLDEIKLTKKPKTLVAYTKALDYFKASCDKLYLEQVERKDLLKFSAFLRDEKEQSARSVYNKFENVMTFLKWAGIRRAGEEERLAEVHRKKNLKSTNGAGIKRTVSAGLPKSVSCSSLAFDDRHARAGSDAHLLGRNINSHAGTVASATNPTELVTKAYRNARSPSHLRCHLMYIVFRTAELCNACIRCR